MEGYVGGQVRTGPVAQLGLQLAQVLVGGGRRLVAQQPVGLEGLQPLHHYHRVVAAGGGHVLLLRRQVTQGGVGKGVVAGCQLNRFGEDQAAVVVVLSFGRVVVAVLLEVAQNVSRRAPGERLVALAVFGEDSLARRLGGLPLALVEAKLGVIHLEAAVVGKLRGQLPGQPQGLGCLVLLRAGQNQQQKEGGFGFGVKGGLGGAV